ncbi:MAG: spore coat protein GerQ [Erysipelotrichaceae bacterium]|nr:spore coat protein GerQ [Erysipelotrichaceae bacterium]
MNFNNYNSQINQNVPLYPTPNSEYRDTPKQTEPTASITSILDTKDAENSFVNSVLKRAVGKTGKFFFSYPDSIKWRDMMYEGKLLAIGEDYIAIKEKGTELVHVLLLLYLEYIIFEYEAVV